MDTEARGRILTWREDIVSEAKSWLGTPFHHKGRKKGVGVDCGGLIFEVYKSVLGLPHESFPKYYAEDWALHKDNNEIYLSFLQPYVKEVSEPQPADIVMWKFGRAFSHGTIYIGGGKFIHSYGRTQHGSVMVSKASMFNIGTDGIRPNKCFTLDEKWLS